MRWKKALASKSPTTVTQITDPKHFPAPVIGGAGENLPGAGLTVQATPGSLRFKSGLKPACFPLMKTSPAGTLA